MIVKTVPDAHVVMGSRSAVRGEKAVAEVIASEPTAAGRVELLEIDVADDRSVAAAAKDCTERDPNPWH